MASESEIRLVQYANTNFVIQVSLMFGRVSMQILLPLASKPVRHEHLFVFLHFRLFFVSLSDPKRSLSPCLFIRFYEESLCLYVSISLFVPVSFRLILLVLQIKDSEKPR